MNPAVAELRDIHMPDPVSLWPLAPGWWLLLALLVISILIGLAIYGYWRHALRFRQQALRQLKHHYQQDDDALFLQHTAALLKRTALHRHPEWAAMNGEQWQQSLQTVMPTDIARLIAVSRYQRQPDFDKAAVYQAAVHWIRKHR